MNNTVLTMAAIVAAIILYGALGAVDVVPLPWGETAVAAPAASVPAETPEQIVARQRHEAEAAAQWAASQLAAVEAAERKLAGTAWRVIVDAGSGVDCLLRLPDGELVGAKGRLFPEFLGRLGAHDRLTVVVSSEGYEARHFLPAMQEELIERFGARLSFEGSDGATLKDFGVPDPGPTPK